MPHSRFLGWSDEDQDKALEYLRLQRDTCSNCGTRDEEWVGNRTAYIGWSRRCPGCEALEQERQNVRKAGLSDIQEAGMKVFLVPEAQALRLIEQGEEGRR